MTSETLFTPEELAEQQRQDPNLPPPGQERREVLAERKDTLEEKAENSGVETGKIPEHLLEPDREIQDMIQKDYLAIGINHPYLKTKWVNYVNQHGTKIWEEKAKGWVVIDSNLIHEFPDAKDFQREDGTIRVGDVLLMCMRIDRYQQMQEREKEQQRRQQFGVEAEVHALAEKHGDIFKNVHTDNTGTIPANVRSRMESQAASKTAVRHIGNKMKEGAVPGIPLPGQRE